MRIDSGVEEDKVELNLTPMIDVVFNLIIFFMVATKFAEVERDMRINPPAAVHASPVTSVPRELIVNVAVDGRYIVSGIEYTLEDLERLIARAAAENADQSVVIRGDRAVVLQYPVTVLSLCDKYGIARRFVTITVPEGGGGP